MTITVLSEGLGDLNRFLDIAPDVTRRAARLAINQTASRTGVRAIKDMMQKQVAFPRGYLSADRIGVTSFATEENLEAAITGRQRPTSLARFAIGGVVGKAGVTLGVNPGSRATMSRAFLLQLRGSVDAFNLGLAIRLRPGERLVGKVSSAKQLQNGLTLLYGPSVDQVFRTVAVDVSPQIAEELADEFVRQFVRLTGE